MGYISDKFKRIKDSMGLSGAPMLYGSGFNMNDSRNNSLHNTSNTTPFKKLQEIKPLPVGTTDWFDETNGNVMTDKEIKDFQNSNNKKLVASMLYEGYEYDGKTIIKIHATKY